MSDGETTSELASDQTQWAEKKLKLEQQMVRIKANLESAAKVRGTAPHVMTHLLRQEQEKENTEK